MERLRENVIRFIRSCLISSKEQLNLKQLNDDYKTIIGECIPFQKLGFTKLEDLIRSAPNEFIISKRGQEYFVVPKESPKSAHISEMVSKQKASKKKKYHAQQYKYRSIDRRPSRVAPTQLNDSEASSPSSSLPSSVKVSRTEAPFRRKCQLIASKEKILKRIPPMLEKHPDGIWARQLKYDYTGKYNEVLPENWLKIIVASPCLQIEKCFDDFMLRYCQPGDLPTTEKRRDVINCIKRLLVFKQKLSLKELNDHYKTTTGEFIPYQKYGFSKLKHFILSAPNDLMILESGEEYYVMARESANSTHVSDRASKQKASKKKQSHLNRRYIYTSNNLRPSRPNKFFKDRLCLFFLAI